MKELLNWDILKIAGRILVKVYVLWIWFYLWFENTTFCKIKERVSFHSLTEILVVYPLVGENGWYQVFNLENFACVGYEDRLKLQMQQRTKRSGGVQFLLNY